MVAAVVFSNTKPVSVSNSAAFITYHAVPLVQVQGGNLPNITNNILEEIVGK
jgi:hypothetical protein